MEYIRFSKNTTGIFSDLSEFLRGCAPYSITTPGYCTLYTTINAYKAFSRLAVLRNYIVRAPTLGYTYTKDFLSSMLGLGDYNSDKSITLYSGKSGELWNRYLHIKRHPLTQHMMNSVCVALSSVAAVACLALTISLAAIACAVAAALLPLIPLFFLICTTVTIEQRVVSQTNSAFKTVRKDIDNFIEKHLSISDDDDDSSHKFTTRFKCITSPFSTEKTTTKSTVSYIFAKLGEVITLAVLIPTFLLVAPISFMIASSVFLLSLCSLEKGVVNRSIEMLRPYALHFLSISMEARNRTHMQQVHEPFHEPSPTYVSPDVQRLGDNIEYINPRV